MDPIDRLTEMFKDFPGIGERQARRFVYFLMSRHGDYTSTLSHLITELKKDITQCKECFRFYIMGRNTTDRVCDICTDAMLDATELMIVEKDSDLESVRKSKVYNGKYFILGGLVPIVERTTKSRVRIEELKNRISLGKTSGNNTGLKEVILAFTLSPQGDHTDQYVREQIREIAAKYSIKISSLGRGLSTGTELEYSDNDTLRNALKNRQ